MDNIDFCARCECVVNKRYDPACYDVSGVCLCKACREWALNKAKSLPDTHPPQGSTEAAGK